MVGTRATAQAAQELEAEASKILSKDLKAPLESVIGIARDSVGPSGGNLSHSFEIIDQTRSALGQKLRTMMTQGVKRPGPPGSSMAHSGTTLTRRHATRQDQPGNCSGKA